MDRSAVDAIADLARRTPRILEAPDHRATGRYLVVDADGRMTERFAERAPEQVELHTVADLAQYVADADDTFGFRPSGLVLVNPDGAVALLEDDVDGGVRWLARLPLTATPLFHELERMATVGVTEFSQRALVRFLRARLHGAVPAGTAETFRRLKLSSDGAAEALVDHGRAAMDRKLTQQLHANGGTVPDLIVATVPVFDYHDAPAFPVEILVEAAPGQPGELATFELTPTEASIRDAIDAATDAVVTELQGRLSDAGYDDISVYRGAPR